jgi:uncharacterized delta-60 repeat protein
MWFLSARKNRRTPCSRGERNPIRLRLEALEDRSLLSAGSLDPTFGALHNGIVTGPIQVDSNYRSNSVVVQPDGKVVVPGLMSGTNGRQNFALVRYNPDGTPDTSFNAGNASNATGSVSTVVGVGDSQCSVIARQSDGKIVAVGNAIYSRKGSNADSAIAVARYNSNGSLDTTFGNNHNGIVLTNVYAKSLNFEYAYGIAIDGSGKIVVSSSSNLGADLIRYNANGSLDTTFNGSGIVIAPPNFGGSAAEAGTAGSNARALAIQPDGKILLGGLYNGGMGVARYTTAGVLDTSFHGSGTISGLIPSGSTRAVPYGILVQSDGAIVLSGDSGTSNTSNQVLARLTSAGQLDLTFGGSNTGFAVNSNMGVTFGIVQGPNGDIITAGTARPSGPTGPPVIGVAAYLPDGTPDTTFGNGGVATADLSGGLDRGRGIAIQPDGKILVSGNFLPDGSTNPNTYVIELVRFQPPNTKVGSFTANPNPIAAGSSVTLSAANILNSNPTSTITQATFYVDNGDSVLNLALDTFLGAGTQTSPGIWTYTSATGLGLPPGVYRLFVQVLDSNGILSDSLAMSFEVLS